MVRVAVDSAIYGLLLDLRGLRIRLSLGSHLRACWDQIPGAQYRTQLHSAGGGSGIRRCKLSQLTSTAIIVVLEDGHCWDFPEGILAWPSTFTQHMSAFSAVSVLQSEQQ